MPWRKFILFMEPLKELSAPQMNQASSRDIAEIYKNAQEYRQVLNTPEEDDTSWWQDPLDKAIGRQKPDNVTRYTPKNSTELMEALAKARG